MNHNLFRTNFNDIVSNCNRFYIINTNAMKDKEYINDVLEDLCRIKRATVYNHIEGKINDDTMAYICMPINNAITFIKEYYNEKFK